MEYSHSRRTLSALVGDDCAFVRTGVLVTIVGGAAIVGLKYCATAVKMCIVQLDGWSGSSKAETSSQHAER